MLHGYVLHFTSVYPSYLRQRGFLFGLFDSHAIKDKLEVQKTDNCLGTNWWLRRIRKCTLSANQCAEISNDLLPINFLRNCSFELKRLSN